MGCGGGTDLNEGAGNSESTKPETTETGESTTESTTRLEVEPCVAQLHGARPDGEWEEVTRQSQCMDSAKLQGG